MFYAPYFKKIFFSIMLSLQYKKIHMSILQGSRSSAFCQTYFSGLSNLQNASNGFYMASAIGDQNHSLWGQNLDLRMHSTVWL